MALVKHLEGDPHEHLDDQDRGRPTRENASFKKEDFEHQQELHSEPHKLHLIILLSTNHEPFFHIFNYAASLRFFGFETGTGTFGMAAICCRQVSRPAFPIKGRGISSVAGS